CSSPSLASDSPMGLIQRILPCVRPRGTRCGLSVIKRQYLPALRRLGVRRHEIGSTRLVCPCSPRAVPASFASAHSTRSPTHTEMPMDYGVVMFPTEYSIQPDDLARALQERGFEALRGPEHTPTPPTPTSPRPPAAPPPRA